MNRPNWSAFRHALSLAALVVAAPLLSCAHPQSRPQLNDGTISRQFDPYTGKPSISIQYVMETVPAPTIERDATDASTLFSFMFVRDPRQGDMVVLRARHECWYNLHGKRVECLPEGCAVKPRTVEAFGRLNGTPAQMPRFECKGWGRAAVEYSAAFSRQAMHAIAAGSEFWLRVPTGEIRMNADQIGNLHTFMEEVERTPAHLGPESVDLRR